MQRIRPASIVFAAALVAGLASFSHAATLTWDGGASTDQWGDANNWDPNGVPVGGAGGDTALIDTPVTIDLNGPQSARLLTFGAANVNLINTGAGGLTLGANDITSTPVGTGVLTRNSTSASTTISTSLTITDVGTSGGATLFAINGSGAFTVNAAVDFSTQGVGSGSLDTTLIYNINNATVEFNNVISGAKTYPRRLNMYTGNGGSVKFSAANTFAAPGGFYVNPSNGTFYLANNNALGASGNVLRLGQADSITNASATTTNVLITDTADAIANDIGARQHGIWVIGSDIHGTATFSGNIQVGANNNGDGVSNLPVRLTAVNADTTTIFSGDIANSGAGDLRWSPIEKIGLGKVILTGTNTYTGDTSVQAGTLQVDGAITASNVSVDNGATLQGVGNITNLVTVLGDLAPGDSIGELSVGAATFGSGGTLKIELGAAGSSDLLTVIGDLDITNAALDLTGAGDGSNYVIASYGTLTGAAFASVTGLPTGYAIDYGSGTNSQITLSQIPEPGTLSLLLAAGVLSAAVRRRP